jgi:hypothetical protein
LQEPDPEILWVVTQIAELPIVYPASLLILLELLGHHTKNRALNQFAIEKLESLGVNYEGSLYQLVGNSTWPPEYGLDLVILELMLKSIEFSLFSLVMVPHLIYPQSSLEKEHSPELMLSNVSWTKSVYLPLLESQSLKSLGILKLCSLVHSWQLS